MRILVTGIYMRMLVMMTVSRDDEDAADDGDGDNDSMDE